jgi:hypothetical protein
MGVMKRLYHERHLRRVDDTGGANSLASALVDLATNTTKAERKALAVKAKRRDSGSDRQRQGELF